MRLLGQTLFAATAIGISLMVAPACVDNDQSIFIRQVMAPPQGECLYQSDPSQVGLFEGTVDVALTDNYSAVLLVGNQMIQRADNLQTRAEPNRAHINGAIVRVTDVNGNDIAEFTSQASGLADPANGVQPNFGLIKVTVLDVPTLARVGGSLTRGQSRVVLANIKAFGESLGGDDLESGEFQFPVRVCNSCTISFANSDDPLTDGVDCNLSNSTAGGGTAGGGAQERLPCFPGQDEITPCTACRGTSVCCRGTAPNCRDLPP